MKKSAIDITGIGTGVIDILHAGKNEVHFPGGSTANTIFGLQKLGLKTGFIGSVGNDQNGKNFIGNLEAAGVDLSQLRKEKDKTTLCHIDASRPERRIMFHEDFKPIQKLSKTDVEYIKNSGAVFLRLSNKLLSPVSRLCRKYKKQLFVTMHEFNTDGEPFNVIKSRKIDVLFSGTRNFEKMKNHIPNILDAGTMLVFTKGSRGCEVYIKNKKLLYNGLKIKPADTTGAGDAFAAGFIFGVSKGWGTGKTCDLANFMGAMATRELGARSAIPTLQDYESYKEKEAKNPVMKWSKIK